MSNAAAATAPGWYFKPNSEHRQPEVYGGEAFIDKYGCVYLGSSEEKVIYLTFDAGYENGNVEKTLDVLKRQEVPGILLYSAQYRQIQHRARQADARGRASGGQPFLFAQEYVEYAV